MKLKETTATELLIVKATDTIYTKTILVQLPVLTYNTMKDIEKASTSLKHTAYSMLSDILTYLNNTTSICDTYNLYVYDIVESINRNMQNLISAFVRNFDRVPPISEVKVLFENLIVAKYSDTTGITNIGYDVIQYDNKNTYAVLSFMVNIDVLVNHIKNEIQLIEQEQRMEQAQREEYRFLREITFDDFRPWHDIGYSYLNSNIILI